MNQQIRFAAVVMFLVAATMLGQAKKAPGKTSSAQAQLKALVDRYYTEWNTGDPEKAAPLYAKDPGLVFFDITPLKYTGWSQYDSGVKDVIASFASAKFTPQQDVKVTVRGTVAWTTVTWHLSGKRKTGEAVELDGRQTLIWENRGGTWLIVHEHFSAPLA